MAQGYILHASTPYVPQLSGALIPDLSALGIDIPAGALMLCHSGDRSGNGGPTFDGAWKRLDQDANAHDNLILGRIATGTAADVGPNVQWPAAAVGAPRSAAISVWVGDVWPDITTIVAAGGQSDRNTASGNLIAYNGCSVGVDNALLIAAGRMFKTATSDGATIGDMNDGNPWTQIPSGNNVRNGNNIAITWNYWQQTTKTNIPLTSQTLSIGDASGNTQGSIIVLKSQVATGGLGLLDDRAMRGEL